MNLNTESGFVRRHNSLNWRYKAVKKNLMVKVNSPTCYRAYRPFTTIATITGTGSNFSQCYFSGIH